MTISAVVLAAGLSSRFGNSNKLLADVGGRPIIAGVLGAVSGSKVQEIVLVTGRDEGRMLAAAGPGRWRHISNPEPGMGMSSSIRVGLSALSDNARGALIVLGDMPSVSSALIDRLIAAFEAKAGEAIVYPVSPEGRQGHPVLWPAALFPELKILTGDSGAKALFSKYASLIMPVPVSGNAAFLDIDTVEDLKSKISERD